MKSWSQFTRCTNATIWAYVHIQYMCLYIDVCVYSVWGFSSHTHMRSFTIKGWNLATLASSDILKQSQLCWGGYGGVYMPKCVFLHVYLCACVWRRKFMMCTIRDGVENAGQKNKQNNNNQKKNQNCGTSGMISACYICSITKTQWHVYLFNLLWRLRF